MIKAEGIFVEETAHDNIIASNTCRRNKNGIGVYSNVVGPVKGNVFGFIGTMSQFGLVVT